MGGFPTGEPPFFVLGSMGDDVLAIDKIMMNYEKLQN
jgi:hypothetical protein